MTGVNTGNWIRVFNKALNRYGEPAWDDLHRLLDELEVKSNHIEKAASELTLEEILKLFNLKYDSSIRASSRWNFREIEPVNITNCFGMP